MSSFDTISFLSDFGTEDEFVGVVKSVIRSIAPSVSVIDISHNVARHEVRAGALTLVRAVQYLCPGVALAVVDPGVGTDRRAVAVEVVAGDERAYFVGPDNGLLASAVMMVGGAARAIELTNEQYQFGAPSKLFAARDVFAPAAAHLCNGVDVGELGNEIDPHALVPGLVPLPAQEDNVFKCEVLWVDHFGNAQLNIGEEELPPAGTEITVRIGDQSRQVRRVDAYGDLRGGELGMVVDSYGMAALVLDRMPAAEMLNIHEGDGVAVEVQ